MSLDIFKLKNEELVCMFKGFSLLINTVILKNKSDEAKLIQRELAKFGLSINKVGICAFIGKYLHMHGHSRQGRQVLKEMFRSWIYATKDDRYPVPSSKKSYENSKHFIDANTQGTMYRYTYGNYRKNLLRHCYQLAFVEMSRRGLMGEVLDIDYPSPIYSITLHLKSLDPVFEANLTSLWQLRCQVVDKSASYAAITHTPYNTQPSVYFPVNLSNLASAHPICLSIRKLYALNTNAKAPRDQIRQPQFAYEDWEHFSGNRTFPVPAPNYSSPASASNIYFKTQDDQYYMGAYGEKRIQFLNYLLKNGFNHFNAAHKFKLNIFKLSSKGLID